MKFYFTDKRPNGKPLNNGEIAGILDLEDGTHPIPAYGKTQEEVYQKFVLNGGYARAKLNSILVKDPGTNAPTATVTAPNLSADEVMQRTTELGVPGKAGAAAADLIQDETGIDLGRLALEQFAKVAMDWRKENPDFYPHPGNLHLVSKRAAELAGGKLGKVTKEIMSQAYTEVRSLLFEDPTEDPVDPANPPSSTTFPGASPVQRTETTETPLFATHVPGTRFRASQTTPPKTPKYTEADIRKMPEKERVRLIKENDRDYLEACDLYFGLGQKTA